MPTVSVPVTRSFHAKKKTEEAVESKKKYRFDAEFFRRSLLLHKLLFPSIICEQTIFFAALLCCGIAYEGIGYYVGQITGKFYRTLVERDLNAFLEQMLNSMLMVFSIAFVLTVRTYIQRCLMVSWRKVITHALHKMYFVNIRFYQLNVLGKCCPTVGLRAKAIAFYSISHLKLVGNTHLKTFIYKLFKIKPFCRAKLACQWIILTKRVSMQWVNYSCNFRIFS